MKLFWSFQLKPTNQNLTVCFCIYILSCILLQIQWHNSCGWWYLRLLKTYWLLESGRGESSRLRQSSPVPLTEGYRTWYKLSGKLVFCSLKEFGEGERREVNKVGWPLATFNAHGAFLKNTSTKRKSHLTSLHVLLKLVCICAVPNIFKHAASGRSMLCQSWRIFLNSRCQKWSCGLSLNSFFPQPYDGMGMSFIYRHSHRLDLLKLVCICAVPNNSTQVFSAGINES